MYNSKLTDEQKEAINHNAKLARSEKKAYRQRSEHKKELKELGKPKRPATAYSFFIEEQQKKNPIKGNLLVYYKDKWNQLDDQQKQPYFSKYEALARQYK